MMRFLANKEARFSSSFTRITYPRNTNRLFSSVEHPQISRVRRGCPGLVDAALSGRERIPMAWKESVTNLEPKINTFLPFTNPTPGWERRAIESISFRQKPVKAMIKSITPVFQMKNVLSPPIHLQSRNRVHHPCRTFSQTNNPNTNQNQTTRMVPPDIRCNLLFFSNR